MRIPFGWLLEHGYLEPGAKLQDTKGKVNATVQADGSIKTYEGNHRGSIHKVGATVQDAPSCNGWTYWHYKDGNKVKPIDDLRQQLRSSIESNTKAEKRPSNATVQ